MEWLMISVPLAHLCSSQASGVLDPITMYVLSFAGVIWFSFLIGLVYFICVWFGEDQEQMT